MVSSAFHLAFAQTTLPWQHADAARRIVYRMDASLAMNGPAVALPVPTNETASVAVVSADAPETLLPIFREQGLLTLQLPGAVGLDRSRVLIAYFGGARASGGLEQRPVFSHDYAEKELGHAWTFADNTTRAVTEFGNNQKVFGHISVTNGWLRLHANGEKILYFSFGQMFGPIPGPRDLHVDSSVYKTLTLRLRQSCEKGTWRVYLCDAAGRYVDFPFDVSGTGPQTFCFDLSEELRNFWDGREFRALRIDPIIKRQGLGATDAEVSSVALMPSPPRVIVGPELSREAVAVRERVSRSAMSVPSSCTAGGTLNASLRLYDASDDRITKSPAVWSVAFDNGTPHIVSSFPDGRRFSMEFPSLTEAGTHAWACGLADDFGAPLRPVRGTINVKPAALAAYRLTPERAFVPAENPVAELSVQGVDRFGNALPVSIRSPTWRCSAGANIPGNRLRGDPAVVRAACPDAVPGVYRFALDDGDGHTGETCVTRIAYRKNAIHLMPNGYLAAADGAPFFPVGGFYANWPHQVLPDGKTLTRSVELFSLGTVLYQHGFPWPDEIERHANAYLKHCRDNGINCLRTFLTNMDLVGRVDQIQLKAVLHYLDLAWSYGIRLDLVLMEGHTRGPYCERDVLEQVALPKYTAEELARLPAYRRRFLVEKRLCKNWYQRWTDPDVLACRKDFLRELIPSLAAHPAIFCYEFENEMPDPPMAWCREMADFLRTIDPHTLVLGNPHPCLVPWSDILCWRESGCDLYSYHPYTDGCPEADQGAVSLCFAKWASQARVPFFPGEGGFYGHWNDAGKTVEADLLARAVRDQNWLSFCAGANGALYWIITQDAQAKEFGKMSAALKAVGFDFTPQRRKRAEVALFHPKDEHVPNDSALAMRLLSLGVDFDTVVAAESGGYSVRVDTASTDPARLSLPSTVAKPAPGWQIATWVSEKRDEAVLYLRNVAGGVKDYGDGKAHRYLRDVRPSEAVFTLVDAWGTLRAFDLDDGTTRILTPDQNGRVSLGVTTHDFVIRVSQNASDKHRAFGSFIATEKSK
jgi:hypothetical protein